MRIFVHNLEFVGAHGVYEEERVEGRRFQVDLEVTVDNHLSTLTDALADTLDYRALAQLILEVGQGPSCHLIEHMAHEITSRVMAGFAQVTQTTIMIRKFATGVPGDPDWVGVELTQQRES